MAASSGIVFARNRVHGGSGTGNAPGDRRTRADNTPREQPDVPRSTNQGELVVDGITAVELELWLDLSVGAALGPPGGNAGVAAARELGTHASPGRQCRDGS
jgi:hypothetical protein